MNKFEKALSTYLSEENLKKVQNVKIGLAGAGGLGSNCAFNLVRSGFKRLKIIDFDRVEATNLNRQFYFLDQVGLPKVQALKDNLKRINPDLEIEAMELKLDESNMDLIFKDCDIVVEAFDKVQFKTMLVERYYASGKFLVAASGLGGWGQSDEILIKKVHSKFYLIGDLVSEVGEGRPPISPRVNVAAAKQADVILDYVIGMD